MITIKPRVGAALTASRKASRDAIVLPDETAPDQSVICSVSWASTMERICLRLRILNRRERSIPAVTVGVLHLVVGAA